MGKRARLTKKQIAERQYVPPEEAARKEHAREQLEQLTEERERTSVPISITARTYKEGDTATSKEALLRRYQKKFPLDIELYGEMHTFICNRKNLIDILPPRKEGEEITDYQYYEECVKTILAVVVDPEWTEDELRELPNSLVTRIARGIQDELSPRFTEDNVQASGQDDSE